MNRDSLSLIPRPATARRLVGQLDVASLIEVRTEGAEPWLRDCASALADALEIHDDRDTPANVRVTATITSFAAGNLGREGFRLQIGDNGVSIQAEGAAGASYAVHALSQLRDAEGGSRLPFVEIEDRPRFGWRGMHLDVSRHFFGVDEILRYLDLLAMHRLNVFHWHLTDDHGWRLEVPALPRLTRIGAWRDEAGTRYGGFYTESDVRRVIDHAKKRHIRVVPEIDVPGHCSAALVAYPELACGPAPKTVPSPPHGGAALCPSQPDVVEFLEVVFDRVIELFPDEIVHVGGDEVGEPWASCERCRRANPDAAASGEWPNLQANVVRWLERILSERGRRLAGWDEVLGAGVGPGSLVTCWRYPSDAHETALQQGLESVIAFHTRLYFDYSPESTTTRGVYEFGIELQRLGASALTLGGQGQVWTERMASFKKIESMALPRMAAMAEILWTPSELHDWPDFQRRLRDQYRRYAHRGHGFDLSPVERFASRGNEGTTTILVMPPAEGAAIHWSSDGRRASADCPLLEAQRVPGDDPNVLSFLGSFGGITSRRATSIAWPILAGEATVETTLLVYDNHAAELALSPWGDDFFWSSRPPVAGDTFEINFREPREVRALFVLTGADDGKDRLAAGILETSVDGLRFDTTKEFRDGQVRASFGRAPVRRMRIRVTAPQTEWLIIRSIVIAFRDRRPTVADALRWARMQTTATPSDGYEPEALLDRSGTRFFWSNRLIQAGDELSVRLPIGFPLGSILVESGTPDGRDLLAEGILETSFGPDHLVESVRFVDGGARIELHGRVVDTVRIRVTRDHSTWLAIRKLVLEPWDEHLPRTG